MRKSKDDITPYTEKKIDPFGTVAGASVGDRTRRIAHRGEPEWPVDQSISMWKLAFS